jgi:flagellar hook assembly protein FlgD
VNALFSTSPNPATDRAAIGYALAGATRVEIRVYDAAGRLVRLLLDQTQPAGFYQVAWDGRRDDGGAAGPGVYFYRMRAGDYSASRKMSWIR